MSQVKALYDYAASEDNELTFQEGDIINTIGAPSEDVEPIGGGGNADYGSSSAAADAGLQRQDTYYQAPQINYDDMFSGVDDTGPKSHTIKGTEWNKERTYFTVSIGNTRKDKKFLGASSELKYEIKSTGGTQIVFRSQDHFIWLHKRLTDKFPGIAVPPLPSKALTAKFEDDAVVGSRGVALETWLNRVLWHPVLRNATALTLFLTQTDDKAWKEDRKNCEKDKIINQKFYGTVATEGTLPENIDTLLADFKKFLFFLDKAIKQVQAVQEIVVKRSHAVSSDCKNIAVAVSKLNMVDEGFVWHQTSPNSQALAAAFTKMTDTYNNLAQQYTHNGNHNFSELSRMLDEWLGYIRSYQDVIKIRDTAMNTYLTQYQKYVKSGIQDDAQKALIAKIKRTTDIVTTITAAESAEFHIQYLVNFKNVFCALVKNQGELHQRINQTLTDLQTAFENVPSMDPQVGK